MQLPAGKKIYFLSDFHLGSPSYEASRAREQKLLRFFEQARQDAHTIFIVGDMFDFWFEYKYVVPKGYVRILGKLAELVDSGIHIEFFVGNHDMWMKDYFSKELGIPVHFEAQAYEFSGKKFYVAHGDGLGPGDNGYKFLKRIFRNPISQFLFGILPPSIGMGLANYSSRKSRETAGGKDFEYLGEDREWLIMHSKDMLKTEHFDYFIYGHRHAPALARFSDKYYYVNLGDWIRNFTYAVFDGSHISLETFV